MSDIKKRVKRLLNIMDTTAPTIYYIFIRETNGDYKLMDNNDTIIDDDNLTFKTIGEINNYCNNQANKKEQKSITPVILDVITNHNANQEGIFNKYDY